MLEGVSAGEYLVEVASRAVNPAVRGTQKVAIVMSEDAEVNVAVP